MNPWEVAFWVACGLFVIVVTYLLAEMRFIVRRLRSAVDARDERIADLTGLVGKLRGDRP